MNTMTKLMIALTIASATSACVPEPDPTTFTLVNAGESEIYHDVTNRWLSLEADGEPMAMFEPGCMTECGALRGEIICAAEAAIYPTVQRLEPGDSSVQEWDGSYYEIDDERGCYREHQADADFEVTFCYGYDYEPIDGEIADESGDTIGGATVKDPVCESVTIERGGNVELLAE